jgi:uncharacterized protein (DUF4415 family)
MRKNASRPDKGNPEWSEKEIRDARPLMEVLPAETAAAVRRYRGQRGPQQSPTKELISLRVDRDVVAAYRATGTGWQTRANDALKAYAKKSGLVARAGGSRRRRATPASHRSRTASR